MSEDWAAIAAEVAGALEEVGFTATIVRPTAGPSKPWDTTSLTSTTYDVTVVDDGIRDFYVPGGLVARQARVLTIGATGVTPESGDRIIVRGETHEVAEVRETAPGGVALLFEVLLKD